MEKGEGKDFYSEFAEDTEFTENSVAWI